MTNALKLSVELAVTPETLYGAWLSSAGHAKLTGGAQASVEPKVGGAHTAWDGYITGKNLVLEAPRRIVQSWRTTEFPAGAAESRVELRFDAVAGGTRLTLDHSAIPEGQSEMYAEGWVNFYFVPMRTLFGQPKKAAPKKAAPKKAAPKKAAPKKAAPKKAAPKKPAPKKAAPKKAAPKEAAPKKAAPKKAAPKKAAPKKAARRLQAAATAASR